MMGLMVTPAMCIPYADEIMIGDGKVLKFENEYESIEVNEAGSVDGHGVMITVYDECGNDIADPFFNKEQTIQLRDYLNKVIESGWLDNE